MAKLLFIVRAYSLGGPLPLRFQKIIEQLRKRHIIHVVEFSHEKKQSFTSNGIVLHKFKYSFLGGILNRTNTKSEVTPKHHSKQTIYFHSIKLYIFRFIKSLFFPDTFITEINTLKRGLKPLLKKEGFDAIIGSAFPFSILIISKMISKVSSKKTQFIYDIGDPFFKNARNNFLRNLLANVYEKKYLKYIDNLVVTNELTKILYLKTYKKILKEENIHIVEQGIELPKFTNQKQFEIPLYNKKIINLIYAGQFYTRLRNPFKLYAAINELNNRKVRTFNLNIYGNISKKFHPKAPNYYIHFRGKTENKNILKLTADSDIVIFIDNSFGYQTPGKVFEVIASNKPVLFITENDNSPAYTIAKKFKNIYKCSNNQAEISNKLTEIVNSKELPIYTSDLSDFSWECRAVSFEKVIIRTN